MALAGVTRLAGLIGEAARAQQPQQSPTMLHIVLVQPEIPPNTGNVIRLAANTGCSLHLVEPLGFSMDDKLLRRAGLDYHEFASVQRHADWPALQAVQQASGGRAFAFTTRGALGLADVAWQAGDWRCLAVRRPAYPLKYATALRPSAGCGYRCGPASAA